MLLIDASNLGAGGGGTLLKCLLDGLVDRDFLAIVSRKSGIETSGKIAQCDVAHPLGKKRHTLLKKFVADLNPSRILFFGNLPSLEKFDGIETFTYFQNAILIRSLARGFRQPIHHKIKFGLLRRFLENTKNNTDQWIFQTSYIRDSFVREYSVSESRTHVYPFFDLENLKEKRVEPIVARTRKGFVYLSDAYPHKNHARLLEAWGILKDEFNQSPTLHLTVNSPLLTRLIDKLNATGCNIVNHGSMPRQEALALSASCEFTVFPSQIETIGLGLIEGTLLGSKVVCSDIAAFEEIVKPSATFDALSPRSIAKSIEQVLTGPSPDSRVVLENRLEQLIDFLFAPEKPMTYPDTGRT